MLRKRHRAGVKPAIDDLRHAAHRLSAMGTGNLHLINIRAVQFDIRRLCLSAQLRKLFPASDGELVPAVLTLPDVQRRAPVTVSGNTPVLDILQPVSETALADGFRNPVDGMVVRHQLVAHLGHLDKPRLPRVIDERRVAPPAVRVVVLKFGRVKEQPLILQIL